MACTVLTVNHTFMSQPTSLEFWPACLVTELMIIPIPTSLPRSSSIDQCNSGYNFSASEKADQSITMAILVKVKELEAVM